jgi:FkbM family methyltransferase
MAFDGNTPDLLAKGDAPPFGSYSPTAARARLLRLAQTAPRNALGKQLARTVRALYLWQAPSPSDVSVGELRLRCWLSDNTCERKFVFTPWRFDVRELAAIDEVLPPDGVFIDIGANVGIYTLHAATRMNGRGHIVAFEPFPDAHDRLRFNIESTRRGRGDWPRVDVARLGVADSEGTRELTVDAGNLGGNSLAAGAARYSRAGAGMRVTIECRPLLAALIGLRIARVDALKIDIEGAEDLALCPFLAHAPRALLPRRIVLENSDALWKRDLRAALAGRGYGLLFRTRLNSVYDLRSVPVY